MGNHSFLFWREVLNFHCHIFHYGYLKQFFSPTNIRNLLPDSKSLCSSFEVILQSPYVVWCSMHHLSICAKLFWLRCTHPTASKRKLGICCTPVCFLIMKQLYEVQNSQSSTRKDIDHLVQLLMLRSVWGFSGGRIDFLILRFAIWLMKHFPRNVCC